MENEILVSSTRYVAASHQALLATVLPTKSMTPVNGSTGPKKTALETLEDIHIQLAFIGTGLAFIGSKNFRAVRCASSEALSSSICSPVIQSAPHLVQTWKRRWAGISKPPSPR
jgi:hypothetical protein